MRVASVPSNSGTTDWLCILLINSVENRRVSPVDDFLTDLPWWITWLQKYDIVDSDEAAAWSKLAKSQPDRAAKVLADAKEIREVMYRVFSTVADGNTPDGDDMARLNERIAAVYSHLELQIEGHTPHWGWRDADGDLSALFWPALHSAAQLLTSDEFDRLRNCDGDKCTWLFVDHSKNRSRRWCTMDVCGNRAKSKRHYAKVKRES